MLPFRSRGQILRSRYLTKVKHKMCHDQPRNDLTFTTGGNIIIIICHEFLGRTYIYLVTRSKVTMITYHYMTISLFRHMIRRKFAESSKWLEFPQWRCYHAKCSMVRNCKGQRSRPQGQHIVLHGKYTPLANTQYK